MTDCRPTEDGLSPAAFNVLNHADVAGIIGGDIGTTSSESLAMFRLDSDAFQDAIGECLRAGFLEEKEDGWYITGPGQEAAAAQRDRDLRIHETELRRCYEAFTAIDLDLKALVTDWQMKSSGEDDEFVPNEHDDPDYDSAVIARLGDVHARTEEFLDLLGGVLPRYEVYRGRLERAIERVMAGQTQYLAKYSVDSYHTIWFQLHEDLIRSLGEQREE